MNPIASMSAAELAAALAAGEPLVVLDVRQPEEVAIAAIPGAVNIPLPELPQRFTELDASQRHVALCHHGLRSFRAAQFLATRGFGEVVNLTGGIDAWSVAVDPKVRRY